MVHHYVHQIATHGLRTAKKITPVLLIGPGISCGKMEKMFVLIGPDVLHLKKCIPMPQISVKL